MPETVCILNEVILAGGGRLQSPRWNWHLLESVFIRKSAPLTARAHGSLSPSPTDFVEWVVADHGVPAEVLGEGSSGRTQATLGERATPRFTPP